MIMQTNTVIAPAIGLFLASILLVGAECARLAPAKTPFDQFQACFPTRTDWPDTLHCFLQETPAGVAISDTLLKTVLDSAQFESLHFGTGEARYWALGQLPFEAGLSAFLLQTEEFWFGKQNLLVFDPRGQKCLTVVELSHFYGGDGGQTASESWLFRKKIPNELFYKTAEHWIAISDTSDEPQEQLRENGQLYQWQDRQFLPIHNPDSSLFLQQFRMHRTW